MPSVLDDLDRKQIMLQEMFPGWRIWYVWNQGGYATWCAQPAPVLNTDSAEHLIEAIRHAHESASEIWPALASLNEYAVTSPGARQSRAGV